MKSALRKGALKEYLGEEYEDASGKGTLNQKSKIKKLMVDPLVSMGCRSDRILSGLV